MRELLRLLKPIQQPTIQFNRVLPQPNMTATILISRHNNHPLILDKLNAPITSAFPLMQLLACIIGLGGRSLAVNFAGELGESLELGHWEDWQVDDFVLQGDVFDWVVERLGLGFGVGGHFWNYYRRVFCLRIFVVFI